MTQAKKDTIYIDVDDEITAIIEKVRAADSKIIALVLPKRTTTLKSIVNMRLLKRISDEQKKNIVLITSEASLLPLAGAVGVHVAKTLQSKPAIPSAPDLTGGTGAAAQEESVDAADDTQPDPTKPIGELAGLPADEEPEDEIEVDNAPAAAEAGKKSKDGFNKKLKVPNFEKFRLRLILGVLALIVLIVGLSMASGLNKATVTITTDSSTVDSDVTMTAGPKITSVDKSKMNIPDQLVTLDSDGSATAPATGQKDNGHKATGTLALRSCTSTVGTETVLAGTGVSTGGLYFITQSAAVLTSTTYDSTNNCLIHTATVSVTAQAGGTKYNLDAGKTFAVAGYSDVTGTNPAAITGGTSNIVKVVSQADIDAANKALIDQLSNQAKDDLTNKIKSDDTAIALTDSFASKVGKVKVSAKVGDAASEVTVSGTVTFSMVSVLKDDLNQFIQADAQKNIDTSKQAISDTGLNNAVFKITNAKPSGDLTLEVQTTVTAGAHLDGATVKSLVAGKKQGDAKSALTSRPGVKDVTVKLSPFWASSIPTNQNKITVKIENTGNNAASNP